MSKASTSTNTKKIFETNTKKNDTSYNFSLWYLYFFASTIYFMSDRREWMAWMSFFFFSSSYIKNTVAQKTIQIAMTRNQSCCTCIITANRIQIQAEKVKKSWNNNNKSQYNNNNDDDEKITKKNTYPSKSKGHEIFKLHCNCIYSLLTLYIYICTKDKVEHQLESVQFSYADDI